MFAELEMITWHHHHPKMPRTTIFSNTVLFQFFNLTTSFTELNFSPFSGCDCTLSCGNIHNLSYPFTGGNQPDHCGPPEFHLSCVKNSYPELTVNSVVYRVLEVNLTGTSLVLARSDLWNNTCPTKFLNSSLDPNIFDSDNGRNVDLTIFYGCSSSPVLVQQQNRFYCDVGVVDLTDSFFIIGEVPIDSIRNVVTVPLLKSVGAELNRSLLPLAEALTWGFEVVYSDPYIHRCDECGRLDGECGFNVGTRQFVCIYKWDIMTRNRHVIISNSANMCHIGQKKNPS
ncbi:putative wall-associated receptor kinase, galacturonan-binding domain-containing protein [Helianthus anomalus]